MKTLLPLFLFSIVVISVKAQNTDKEEYLTARIVARSFTTTYLLYLDYSGAKGKDYMSPNSPVYDSLGYTVKFKSESAALNYLGSQSWTMVSAIPILSQGTSLETKYIFRRKITGKQPLPFAKPTAE